MAVEISDGGATPHAVDYADLLDKLVTFATANGWVELENTSDKVVLQGEGTGSDEIFIAFQKYANVGAGAYGWRLNGYTAYNGSGITFLNQPGAIQVNQIGGGGYPIIPLWDNTIPYWFIVSGRRIIVVAKVSTTYQVAYLGWYMPFASPGQYPYPLCIGGSFFASTGVTEPLYSGGSGRTCAFWDQRTSGFGASSLMTRLPGGSWYSTGGSDNPSEGLFPYNQVAELDFTKGAVDGTEVLNPIEIHHNVNSPVSHHRLGELDGVFHISGFAQSAENIVTVGADDYLVTPNVFRSGIKDFAAIKLV